MSEVPHEVLGVDIGGSGMKAALVDVNKGELRTDRFRIPTPKPATPSSMADVFGQLLDHFDWTGPVGCTFPGVIRGGAVVGTAANLDASWVGVNAAELLGSARASTPGSSSGVTMINDADAAGLAEMLLGSGIGVDGVVFMLTIGTGFGTAIFHDGKLLPNIELGHIMVNGVHAESYATSRARKAQGLTTKVWAARLQQYLDRLEELVSPDMFIIGGGVSKSFDEFAPLLSTQAQMRPATLRNHAGIVGAAMAGVRTHQP